MTEAIRMDYDAVEITRQILAKGAQDMAARLEELARDMTAMSDGRGNWITAFHETKKDWDTKIEGIATTLTRAEKQLDKAAIATQDADLAGAKLFGNIGV
ncbi:MAG: WXG100 family type VII secretion target [Propionibacteriaceae bacterium]|jgi:uncharacterized protein YukE|nr:WXG100 family type VII secretion target [Propionibacteriaceae bacterium]